MRNLLLLIVVGLGALLLGPASALACSCAPPPAPSLALEASDLVFEGTVVGIPPEPAENEPQGFGAVEYRFNVARSWKGDPGMEVRLKTGSSGAMCGRQYNKGATYIVYASIRDNEVHDSLCSRTRTLEHATDDLSTLGEGTVPRSRGGVGRPAPPVDEAIGEQRPTTEGEQNQTPPGSDAQDSSTPVVADDSGAETAATEVAPSESTQPVEEADATKTESATKGDDAVAKPQGTPTAQETEDEGGPKEGCSMSAANGTNGFGIALFAFVFVGLRRRIGT